LSRGHTWFGLVPRHVLPICGLVDETHGTDGALEWELPSVVSHVLSHLERGPELLPAYKKEESSECEHDKRAEKSHMAVVSQLHFHSISTM
jgi:hypothetical protein